MIFKANWQLLLKWHLSYGFLPKTEECSTLTPAQGGGQKGCSTIDQANHVACWQHGADVAYLCLHAKTHSAMKYYV